MRAPRRLAPSLVTLALVASAGCSSSGGSPSTPVAVATAGSASSARTAKVTITLRVPIAPATSASAARRSPQYLSYATKSAVFSYSNNGGTPTQVVLPNLSPTATGCAAQGPDIVCTTTSFAPVGSDVFSATTYDAVQAPNATSNFVGNVLSTLTGFTVTVVAGTNVPVALTLGGVVANAKISIANPNPNMVPTTTGVAFFAYDADNYLIVGPYAAPVRITDSDATATTVQINGGTPGTSVLTSSSSDTIALTYTGAALAGATLSGSTAQMPAPTIASATFTPATTASKELVYVGGPGGPQFAGVQYLVDLGTATSTGAQTSTIPTYLYTFGNARSVRTDSQNGIVYGNQIANSTTNDIEYETRQTAPMPAPATPPAFNTPTVQTITNKNSFPQLLSSNAILTLGFQPNAGYLGYFFSPIGEGAATNPTVTVNLNSTENSIAAAKLDLQGNLWIAGQNSLSEYSAASITNPVNGAMINPITTINGGGAAGNYGVFGINGGALTDLTFDVAGNIYVLATITTQTTGNNVKVFPASVRGTTGTPVASEYFDPAPATATQYTGIDIEPSTGYIVLTGSSSPGRLDFFASIGQNGAPAGGNLPPFKSVTLPFNAGGSVNFLR